MTWRAPVALIAVAGGLSAAALVREPEPESVPVAGARVAAPEPPRGYLIPARAVRVRDGADLARLLARPRPLTIRLAAGRYAPPPGGEPRFRMGAAHRLYSEQPGRAVLAAGLVVGGNYLRGGAHVQGLAFDFADARAASEAAAVHVWGVTGKATTIADATFRGHGALDAAIRADQVAGLTVERVRMEGFRRFGLYASDNDPRSRAAAQRITDVEVSGVKLPRPGSGEGRAEFGVWIGNRVREPVARLRVRDFGWGGIWTGNSADDLILRDLDVDASARRDGVAIYIEHKTRRSVFERFRLGPDIKEGFVSEAAHDGDDTGGGIDNTIRDGVIDTGTRRTGGRVGIHLGLRTVGTRISRVRFRNADRACIVDAGDGTVLGANDYAGRARGADVLDRE